MLTDTTRKGTARRAFTTSGGRPLLQGLNVAAKTGSLSGVNPPGRYEWFIGVAPVERPSIALAVLVVQGDLYWLSASQLAAEILKILFCSNGVCSEHGIERFSMNPIERDAQTILQQEGLLQLRDNKL
jgi:cell division protein FtsI/penicillin-binding protein 2